MRQREIEVITAEYQVVTHGNSMELNFAISTASHPDQGKVRCSSTNIANQNILAR